MDEVLQFMLDNKVFFIATIDGDKPNVRPFGLVFKFREKLYFGTSNQKQVYQQLQKNPYCEISAASAEGQWLRLKGKAVFDNDQAAKEKVFEVMPQLKNIYKDGAQDPLLEVFYLDEADAEICSMIKAPKKIKF